MGKVFVIRHDALEKLLENHRQGVFEPLFAHGAMEFDSVASAESMALKLGPNWIVWTPEPRLNKAE